MVSFDIGLYDVLTIFIMYFKNRETRVVLLSAGEKTVHLNREETFLGAGVAQTKCQESIQMPIDTSLGLDQETPLQAIRYLPNAPNAKPFGPIIIKHIFLCRILFDNLNRNWTLIIG